MKYKIELIRLSLNAIRYSQDAAAHIRFGPRFGGGKTNLAETMEVVRDVFSVQRSDWPFVADPWIKSNTKTIIFICINKCNIKLNLFANRSSLYSQDAAAHIRFGPRFGGGKTNLAETMEVVRDVFTVERGDRPFVQNIVLTFTDGGSNIRANETIAKATGMYDHIYIYIVWLT